MLLSLTVAAILIVMAAAAGWRAQARVTAPDWFTRVAAAIVPPAAMCFAMQAAVSIALGTFFVWDDIRLARSVSLFYGYRLYYGPAEIAPIIGTLHTPLTQLIYVPIGFLTDPTAALIAGACLSLALLSIPLAWLHLRHAPANPHDRTLAWLSLIACGFLLLASPGVRYSMFHIHTDAGALAFATVAAGMLYRHAKPRALAVSALFAMLAVWSKQTMFPLLLALPLFVLIWDGGARALRYVLLLAAAGVAVSAAVVAMFWPPAAMRFNILTLAGHRVLKPDSRSVLLDAWSSLRSDAGAGLVILLFFAIYAALFARQDWREHRWLVFALTAIAMAPVAVSARVSQGGDVNHWATFSYFITIAGTLAMCRALILRQDAFLQRASKVLLVAAILSGIDPGAIAMLLPSLRTAARNPTQIAYRFALEHPGAAYFPWNPLVALVTEGTLYHFDFALYDREIRNFPVSRAQFQAHIPADFRFVAVPPGEQITSAVMKELVAPFDRVDVTGLEGWTVYRVPR